MKLLKLMQMEEALALLREARDLAARGWILKGRDSIHHMPVDCFERAAGQRDIIDIPNPAESYALRALCEALGNDPGSSAARVKKIAKWQYTRITQDRIIRAFERAVDVAKQRLANERARSTPAQRSQARATCKRRARRLLESAALTLQRDTSPMGSADSAIVDAIDQARNLPQDTYVCPLRRKAEPHSRVAMTALYRVLVGPHVVPKVHMQIVDGLTGWERRTRPPRNTLADAMQRAAELV